MTALNEQVGGNHYKDFAIQPVEFIHRNEIDFISGNVIKYICRWKSKGGINDLEKAKHYIELLIELSTNKSSSIVICNKCSLEHKNSFRKITLSGQDDYFKCECDCHKETKGAVPDKEITDTERLDFIDKENLEVWRYRENWKSKIINKTREYEAETARQAIDAAMRGKDGN